MIRLTNNTYIATVIAPASNHLKLAKALLLNNFKQLSVDLLS